MKKHFLFVALIFSAVLANASEYLTPVMHPDEGRNSVSLLNILIASAICIAVGIYLIGLDKKLKNELKNKN